MFLQSIDDIFKNGKLFLLLIKIIENNFKNI